MAFGTTNIVDAVVIGAGLSGLSAATQLAKAKKSVVVLEARDRVGGKTWTVKHKDGTLDLGGAWMNENTQRSIVRYAREFGLELFPQNTDGDCLLQLEDGSARRYPYGEPWPVDQEGVDDLANIREIIETQAAKINMRDPAELPGAENWDKLSIRTFCDKYAKSEWTKKTLELWSRIMFGVEPENMSILYFFDYMRSGGSLAALRSDRSDGSQALRSKQGTQPISKGLAARLGSAVKLNSPVASVSYSSFRADPCVVTTRDGTSYKCKRVICTVPTTLYKEIEWTPALPSNKLRLVNNTEMGYYSKVSNVTCIVSMPLTDFIGHLGIRETVLEGTRPVWINAVSQGARCCHPGYLIGSSREFRAHSTCYHLFYCWRTWKKMVSTPSQRKKRAGHQPSFEHIRSSNGCSSICCL